MKDNHCHLFLIVLVLSPVTLFTNPVKISANPLNPFPIFPSRMKPLLSGENELQSTLHLDFRELQMENLKNLENQENLENNENIESTENTENIEEEANLGPEKSSNSTDCEIDSVTTARLLSSGTLPSKAKDRRLENKESQNESASESQQDSSDDIWCEIDRECEMTSVFGLGRISVCENFFVCVSGTSAEEECQTVRTCSCVFRPGIGKIQLCRSQLVCD